MQEPDGALRKACFFAIVGHGRFPETKRKTAHIAEMAMLRGFSVARCKGLEPLTFWFVAKHSIQLS